MASIAPVYNGSKAARRALVRQFTAADRKNHIVVDSMGTDWARANLEGSIAHKSVEDGADFAI